MEYKQTETNENKPIEKSDVSAPRESAPASDSTGGESDAGQNGFDDGNVDLSRSNISESQVERVNDRMPINCEYAGKTYPVENLSPELQKEYPNSVDFNEKGFPDFSPYAKAEVQIEYTGNRRNDFIAANKAAEFEKTPEDYTWHHHEDAKTMQLVPTDLHDEIRHTGGCATSGMEYNKRK